ncbi:hypothetical protein LY13_003862 [Prauserella aidingensis]|nr:hypothetical protein [Prauserella aidingensis]MCP2255088.1 hypothetical protein [Prauserella aidingensis]
MTSAERAALLADALRQLADAAALVADHLDPKPSTNDRHVSP